MKKKKISDLSLNKTTISNFSKEKINGGVEAVVGSERFCDPVSFQNTNCCWTWYGPGCQDDWTWYWCAENV